MESKVRRLSHQLNCAIAFQPQGSQLGQVQAVTSAAMKVEGVRPNAFESPPRVQFLLLGGEP